MGVVGLRCGDHDEVEGAGRNVRLLRGGIVDLPAEVPYAEGHLVLHGIVLKEGERGDVELYCARVDARRRGRAPLREAALEARLARHAVAEEDEARRVRDRRARALELVKVAPYCVEPLRGDGRGWPLERVLLPAEGSQALHLGNAGQLGEGAGLDVEGAERYHLAQRGQRTKCTVAGEVELLQAAQPTERRRQLLERVARQVELLERLQVAERLGHRAQRIRRGVENEQRW